MSAPASACPQSRIQPNYWRPVAWLWGALLGAALQLQQPQLWLGGWYLGIAAAGVLLAMLLVRPLMPWRPLPRACLDRLACGVAGAALAFGAAGWRAAQQMQTQLDPALEGADLVLEGVIVAMPLPVAAGQRFRLAVVAAQRAGQSVAVPPLVDVAWYGGWVTGAASAATVRAVASAVPHLAAGQRWRLPVRLKAPHGSANPYGFDYELWMWEQGVQATGYVRVPRGMGDTAAAVQPQLLAEGHGYAVERLRQRVRDAMVQRLAPDTAYDGAPDASRARIVGVLVALVTGEQRAIDREDWRLFRMTGVAHLMAISGLHITLFAWVAAVLISAAWRRSARLCLWLPAPRVALVGGVLCALAYAVFSGWGVPAQRTVLMLAVVAMLRLSGRQWPWYMTWLLACAAVVLAQPMALVQAGFWLSFLAVGILFATDFRASSARQSGTTVQKHAKSAVLRLLREQGVVTVALTPLSLLMFGQVSVVGLVANLLAIPWVTWVVTPLALLGTLLPPLWDVAVWAMQPLMACLQWLAQLPGAALWLAQAPWWAATAAVLGGVCMVLPLPWQLRLMGLPLVLPALWWQPVRPPAGQFSLLALDVGQGQAVLVQTAGHSLLYDAGPLYGPGSNAGDRVVVPALRALGAGALDMLVLSHADSDHTGGAAAVAQQLQPAQLLGSLLPHERAMMGVNGPAPWRDCVAGTAWEWDGVRFLVLHPDGAPPAPTSDASIPRSGNSRSCVLRVQAAPTQGHAAAALLMGDLEKAQEQTLVQRSSDGALPDLRADVLLVPHHGSQTSSSAALLAAVQPRWAIAQMGYRNRFQHPAAPVVQRYAEAQIPLLTTVACGAALWQSDAPGALSCQRQQRAHYWRHQVPLPHGSMGESMRSPLEQSNPDEG